VIDCVRVARRTNGIANRHPRLACAWSRLHARLYRLSGGRVVARWFGAPVLVLETVGRRSGKRRAAPVLYLRDGERYVVLAANAGADRAPAWWLNLREAGEARVVVGQHRARVRPRRLEAREARRLWSAFVTMYPAAAEYRRMTSRDLPLVALETV
jgi:deazaflavin-dependent oxidoreductase (nitroreductase family)